MFWVMGQALTMLVQSPSDRGTQDRAPGCSGLRVVLQVGVGEEEFEEGLQGLTTRMASWSAETIFFWRS